jgi:hypothetical protein
LDLEEAESASRWTNTSIRIPRRGIFDVGLKVEHRGIFSARLICYTFFSEILDRKATNGSQGLVKEGFFSPFLQLLFHFPLLRYIHNNVIYYT